MNLSNNDQILINFFNRSSNILKYYYSVPSFWIENSFTTGSFEKYKTKDNYYLHSYSYNNAILQDSDFLNLIRAVVILKTDNFACSNIVKILKLKGTEPSLIKELLDEHNEILNYDYDSSALLEQDVKLIRNGVLKPHKFTGLKTGEDYFRMYYHGTSYHNDLSKNEQLKKLSDFEREIFDNLIFAFCMRSIALIHKIRLIIQYHYQIKDQNETINTDKRDNVNKVDLKKAISLGKHLTMPYFYKLIAKNTKILSGSNKNEPLLVRIKNVEEYGTHEDIMVYSPPGIFKIEYLKSNKSPLLVNLSSEFDIDKYQGLTVYCPNTLQDGRFYARKSNSLLYMP